MSGKKTIGSENNKNVVVVGNNRNVVGEGKQWKCGGGDI